MPNCIAFTVQGRRLVPQPREREPVGVARRKIADVEADHREARDLHRLAFAQEALGDSALVEQLDRARVQTAGARAGELLALAPLDDGEVDTREGELSRQHHPCRTASGDHYRVLGFHARSLHGF